MLDRGGAIIEPPQDIAERVNGSLLVGSYLQPSSYFRHVVELIRQAALALEHAHQSGVMHRDIKPANLLVDENDHVWVTDFGLARISTDEQLTRTGAPLGTLRYMSPEQAAGSSGLVDHRSDIYSLGVTLYELLTLEPAVPGDESHTLLRRVIEDEPRSPRSINKSLPQDLETIVLKAAAKAREERYASAQQFADDLRRWLHDEPIIARPPGVWARVAKWRRRHRVLVRMAAIFTGLAVCGLAFAILLVANAYRGEAKQREAAVASFEQARRAVDAFSELGETELAAKPELRDVRRRLLETALSYYQEFENEHSDDPVALADMAATAQRIRHIVDGLKALEGSAPLLLVSDVRVQSDLQLSDVQRDKINDVLAALRRDRAAGDADPEQKSLGGEKRLTALLRTHERALSAVLTAQQVERLQQIARQQRAPFVFRSAEVINALQLTPEQRRQVNTIIEEERIDSSGRPLLARLGGPSSDPSPDRLGPDGRGPRGGPRGPDRIDEMLDEFLGPAPHPDDHPAGPPPGPFGRHGPPPGIAASKKRAVTRILAILTPEQRATWQRLTGRPFAYDLHWGPDDLLPR
jgi:eukaryotic-like serine/threonine-protein kinase